MTCHVRMARFGLGKRNHAFRFSFGFRLLGIVLLASGLFIAHFSFAYASAFLPPNFTSFPRRLVAPPSWAEKALVRLPSSEHALVSPHNPSPPFRFRLATIADTTTGFFDRFMVAPLRSVLGTPPLPSPAQTFEENLKEQAPERESPQQLSAPQPPSLRASPDPRLTVLTSSFQSLAQLVLSLSKERVAAFASAPLVVSPSAAIGQADTAYLQRQIDALQQQISLTNRINQLENVTIVSPTFSSSGTVSGLTDAAIPDSITASNYLLLSGGTLTGALTGTTASFSSMSFNQSSTTQLSITQRLYVGDTATTTILGSATSTFGAGIQTTALNITGTASSTFANGIQLAGGCFRLADGTCAGSGSGVAGSDGQLQYNNGGSLGGASDFTYDDATNRVGIGTTSPSQLLSVHGNGLFSGNVSAANITATGTILFSGLGKDMLLSTDGSGNLVASSTPTVAAILATSTTATSTFSGGLVAGNNAAFSVNRGATAHSLYIAENGNLGIGTTSPFAKLSIHNSSTDATQPLFVVASSTASATTTLFTILNSGYVGIGTTTPVYPLDVGVVPATANAILVQLKNLNNSGYMRFFTNNSYGVLQLGGSGGSASLQNTTGGWQWTTQLNIMGNLGVATNTPSQALSVHGNALISGNLTSVANITATGTLSVAGLSTLTGYISTASSTVVGPLTVSGPLNASSTLLSSGNTLLALSSGSSVGIATTSPWLPLSVAGRVGFDSSLGTGTGGNYLCIDTTTFEVLRGNGSACTASSLRFKDNIEDIRYGLSEIMQLRPISFNFKSDTNMGTGTHLGFIAEEMQTIIPELVSLDNEGKPFGLDYPTLTAVLVKSIQELNLKVETLGSVSSGAPPSSSSLFSAFLDILRDMGVWIENGLVTMKNVVVDTLTAKEKICIGETCIMEEQLKELLEKNQILPASPSGEPPTVTFPSGESTDADSASAATPVAEQSLMDEPADADLTFVEEESLAEDELVPQEEPAQE